MKKCKSCNAEMADNARFCPSCGAENDVYENVQQANQNVYYTPPQGADAFNGGETVQNVGASKKKSGGKTALIILAVIVVIAVAVIVWGALSEDSAADTGSSSAGASDILDGSSIVEKGIVDESGYTNESLGLRINCPEDWVILAGDDMAEFLEVDPDESGRFEDSDGVVYELALMNVRSGSNIIVSSYEGTFVDKLLSEEDSIQSLADGYESDGDTVSEPFEMTVGGKTYQCIDVDGETIQTPFKQRVLELKEGKQYVCIIITVFPDAEEEGVNADTLIENYFTNN